MNSVEELRRALEASQAETAALRAAAEGADRVPRVNDTDDADEADSAHRVNYDDGQAGTAADGRAGPNAFARQGVNTTFFWGSVEIASPPNSRNTKMRPRCGTCVLGPTCMAWAWDTRCIKRLLLFL